MTNTVPITIPVAIRNAINRASVSELETALKRKLNLTNLEVVAQAIFNKKDAALNRELFEAIYRQNFAFPNEAICNSLFGNDRSLRRPIVEAFGGSISIYNLIMFPLAMILRGCKAMRDPLALFGKDLFSKAMVFCGLFGVSYLLDNMWSSMDPTSNFKMRPVHHVAVAAGMTYAHFSFADHVMEERVAAANQERQLD